MFCLCGTERAIEKAVLHLFSPLTGSTVVVEPVFFVFSLAVMHMRAESVALISCKDYTNDALAHAIDQVIGAVGRPESLNGLQVMLKPNLVSAKNGGLPCTDGRFILAVARWFIDHGASLKIGDSPAFGSAYSVLGKLGILGDLGGLGVSVSNFRDTRTITLAGGVRASMAVDALDCDLLVNMPRVKAHAQGRVTMAVKNCFGCLGGLHKPWWHMVYGGCVNRFAGLLLELVSVLPGTITMVDGVEAMHFTGPISGCPHTLRLVGCGWSPVAVDTALLAVIGVVPEDSPLQRAAVALSLPGSRFADLCFPLSSPQELRVTDFVVPETLKPVRFNPFSFFFSLIKRFPGLHGFK